MAVFDRVLDALALVCGALLTFVMLAVCVDIVLRYYFNSPFMWLAEISEYVLLYVTFLGSAWLLRREGHVVTDLLINALGPRGQAAMGILSSIVGVVICLTLVWYGVEVTWDNFVRGVYRTTILEVPKAPLLAVIPFGSLLLLVQFVRRTLGYVEKWRAPQVAEQAPQVELGL